ncbi:MAG: serine protein kinase RIO, partial [Candidatus Micrarchaeota archaeon]
KKKVVKSIDYPVATGKEADVFRASTETGYLAVKIYRIETSNFLKMQDYMIGDPRFSNMKKNKRDIVFAWTKKEFRNLCLFEGLGVRVPKPVAFKKNVLVMEFIGEEGVPDSTLKQMGTETPEKTLETVLGFVKVLYKHNLVHADLSEYNILMHAGEPYIIDVGQAVLLNHPKAEEFLERDMRTLLKYFGRYGVKRDEGEVLKWVRN